MNTPFSNIDAGVLLRPLKNETSPASFPSVERAILFDFVHSAYSQVFAGFCALLACCITLHHVYCHLKNYTCYSEQRCIIRIVFIIPAYAVYSFTSLMLTIHAPLGSVYVEPLRDIAEAVAIYSFLALCYQYLGGEGSIMLELMGRTIPSSCFYGTCCFYGKPYTILFLRFCKVATLQYTFIKPLTSVFSVVLFVVNKYEVGDFSPNSGYLYLFLINNITVTLALYGLLLFYFATRNQLRPFKPILKFATIKAIIFFSFWQDVLFSLLEWSHLLGGNDDYPSGMASAGLKNILICIELVLASVTLRYAFPYSVYVFHHPPRLVLDLQVDDDNYPNRTASGTAPKHHVQKSSGNLQALRADLLYGTAAFADRSLANRSAEPLPWDVLESHDSTGDVDRDVVHFSSNSTALPSISASIRATMDPTDIFVDAVHNFHPNYRHYTQAKLDDTM